jgi:hypothetical protein
MTLTLFFSDVVLGGLPQAIIAEQSEAGTKPIISSRTGPLENEVLEGRIGSETGRRKVGLNLLNGSL